MLQSEGAHRREFAKLVVRDLERLQLCHCHLCQTPRQLGAQHCAPPEFVGKVRILQFALCDLERLHFCHCHLRDEVFGQACKVLRNLEEFFTLDTRQRL